MAYLYASAFAKVGQSLTTQQKQALAGMRTINPDEPKGPFLYSDPIEMPQIGNTDYLFGAR